MFRSILRTSFVKRGFKVPIRYFTSESKSGKNKQHLYTIPVLVSGVAIVWKYSTSEKYDLDEDRYQEEIDTLSTSYSAGYLADRVLDKTFEKEPVFLYSDNLPLALPGDSYKGFIYSGEYKKKGLTNKEAYSHLKKENYVVCPKLLNIKTNQAVEGNKRNSSISPYEKSDVIITGTCDKQLCKTLKDHFQQDMIWQANDGKIDPNHPFSTAKLFLIDEEKNEFAPIGELIDLKDNQKVNKFSLLTGNYHVTFGGLSKTRLSHGGYEEITAILVPEKVEYHYDQEICDAFMSHNLRNLVTNGPPNQ